MHYINSYVAFNGPNPNLQCLIRHVACWFTTLPEDEHTHMVASDLPRKLNKSAFHQVGSCPAMAGTRHTSRFQMSCMLNTACRLLLQLLFSFFSRCLEAGPPRALSE